MLKGDGLGLTSNKRSKNESYRRITARQLIEAICCVRLHGFDVKRFN